MTLHTYLPQDRLRALSRGGSLPDRTSGAALFADISGFTSLTEGLRESLGSRHGAEELTKHLGTVYTALIAEVEKQGGSVINFAGDAITCWFDDSNGPATPRAATCAFALQTAMGVFSSIALPNGSTTALTLKVALATGAARRFVVGDPTIHYLDALAGATVMRTAVGEHLANKGDVLVDEATVQALGNAVVVKEWRSDENGERFALVEKLSVTSDRLSVRDETVDESLITSEQLRPWIHSSVYDRETTGQASFLTEFRPCVALFVRFTGIDYDSDSAESELDAFIREVQRIASRYDGTLMGISIGDKGSYVYVDFGALSAHEDDPRRAVKAALELREKTKLQLQMGITQGLMRVGTYGGVTRKTFGTLGDEVNLAARLMSNAAPGEVLLSGHAYKAVENYFSSEPRSPLAMKGKAEPLPVFAVTGERQQRAIRLQEPTYALPMVGRTQELRVINDKLELAEKGQGQIIGIVAEAGMGKSRLVAEVIRLARRKGFAGYGGACQSDAVNTPYQTWKSIWQAFFDVDPSAPLKKQMRNLEGEIEDRAPERVQAMPLLNVVLGLEIPDNDFTKTLEPQYRKSALRALLEDCLRAAAKDEPLLIVIEDMHWIDALSHDLLEELARALNDSRVCFVLAYRPPQLARLEAPRLEAMPNFTKIELHELNQAEAESAIRAKLAQLYPARGGALPSGLVDKLMARSQGNPFYLEELLNYVRDRGLDPADLNKIELPDSLHTLILSRIDQLSEREKTTLRVASIVGRLFRVEWLTGYYPELGGMNRVQSDLEQLAGLDITPLDTPEPELAYLFKHIVTHEVTYESLPFATRAKLHEQLAAYLERQIAAGALTEASMLDTLVYHYERSDNPAKQRAYLKKAGQAALDVSALNSARDYFSRLLELTPEDDPERSALALKLADSIMDDFPAARAAIDQAQAAAKTDADRASAQVYLGELVMGLGNYAEGQAIIAEAVHMARASDDSRTLCLALYALGDVNWYLGELEDAKVALDESLSLARALGDLDAELSALNRMGLVALSQSDLAEAERLLREVHTRAVAAGYRLLILRALNNLGWTAGERKDYAMAKEYYQQRLALSREMGWQSAIALVLGNLAGVDIELGQLAAARAGLHEGLALAQQSGQPYLVVGVVNNFGFLFHAEGQTERALALFGLVRNQPSWTSDFQRQMDRTLAEWALDPSVVEAGLKAGEALDWDETVKELLAG
ncbi:AAA family ATPase [Candidatus Villigracilis affinis]|uniref:AAA family ATPase n=1 Tax=Candidatus Villigracilis affinis TaxID=3140682 RepID=UPI002A1E4E95|nr:AAA family ATPase [Anaerolineales bacterium]